ncbi:adenosine receptor A2b-like [Daktulosphaira vitifoliae]|uniref:adenosine receptor A2b-like n=1 Tax=Daktulosphaira vitifoliae TaxID=58002 RepID=UPI0021A9C2F3|nr:adenosine receptor A2b-like [Daktulosphaira vitifoliae]
MNVYTANAASPSSGGPLLNVPYAVLEGLVAVGATLGNGLVIVAFHRERRLRRRTNYYIISLAVADLLVGLVGIPCAVLASMGLPRHLHLCLFSVSLIIVLCTISILSLVAVSADRYWAILYPMAYSTNSNTKIAVSIICICWLLGILIGFMPLMGWRADNGPTLDACMFSQVMDYNYLVFLYLVTIILPALLMATSYAHIYTVILKQIKQMTLLNGSRNDSPTKLRVLGAARKSEIKATQNLSIIVAFFVVCWMPLYTINCVQAFCAECLVPSALLDACIVLSHLNSAGNPLLYAYHLKDFRNAFKSLLLCSDRRSLIGKDYSNGGSTMTHSAAAAGTATTDCCKSSLAAKVTFGTVSLSITSIRQLQKKQRNSKKSDLKTPVLLSVRQLPEIHN